MKPSNPNSCSGQNCTDHYTQYYMPRTSGDPNPAFRFVNDFSNTFQQDATVGYSSAQLSNPLYSQSLPFSSYVAGGGNDGMNSFSNNQLAGSRNVSMSIDVKPYNILGYNKGDWYQPGMVEGFTITNESGVKYTYGLPAYSYGEEAYQAKIDHSHGYQLNRQKKTKAYAYTWYLTSITGPDYVDRDGDGKADAGDWGYWVNLEYGKWSPNYVWRNPSEGYNTDEDNEWQNCSQGYREVYYLNAIRTRTHIALFEKDVRADAKGESTSVFALNTTSADPYYSNPGLFDYSSASSMQLQHIYLLNAADGNFVTPSSGTLNNYVLDASDVNMVGRANLEAKSLRVIDFNYDYSLASGTSNSFNTPGQLMGKLTLLNVNTRGKAGVNLLPPTQFQYELSNPVVALAATQGTTLNQQNGSTPANFVTSNPNFNVGDMVMASKLGVYCGVIISKSPPNGGNYTYTLTNCSYNGGQVSTDISTTKNPPYNKDAYDVWGMYKSDINSNQVATDNSLARKTSVVSAPGADAWALHGISTTLGATVSINYEPDTYYNSSMAPNQQSLIIDQIVPDKVHNTLTLTVDKSTDPSIMVSNSYNVGDKLNALLLMEFHPGTGVDGQVQDGSDGIGSVVTDTRTNSMTFGEIMDNENPTVLGYGYALNYYINQPLSGSMTILSINDGANSSTVVVNCPDQFLLGNASKTLSILRKYGSNMQAQNSTAYIGGTNLGGYYGGNLFITSSKALYGGGSRVSSLSLTDGQTGLVSSTNYGYNDNTGNSSGVSSYTPSMGDACFDFPSQYSGSYVFYGNMNLKLQDIQSDYYKDYRRALNVNNATLFALAREVPAPGVMYGTVTVTKQVKNPDEQLTRTIDGGSKTQYQYEVFKGNMVGRFSTAASQTGTVSNPNYTQATRYLTIGKFISALGNLKSIIQYDNNGKKLTETDYNYLHDNLLTQDATAQAFFQDYKTLLSQYKYQGYIQERFAEVKMVGQQVNAGDNGIKATLMSKEEYPCIPLGQTVINYVNGTRTSTKNLAFDFYSGAVTQSLETDAYGNGIRTDIKPAYTVYTGSSLGLPITSPGNKNMLTQVAEKYTYKVDPNSPGTPLGLISATANIWSNAVSVLDPNGNSLVQNDISLATTTGNIWRQQSTYNWMPTTFTTDGITPYSSFVDFNWTTPASSDSRWNKTTENTLFDVYSKPLEARDVNGNYAATHMTYGENKVMLTGSLASYYEIAYSGAEDAGINQTTSGFIQAGQGTVSTSAAHTGTQSLLLGAGGKQGFTYTTKNLSTGRSYVANVWVKPVSGTASTVNLYYSVNGGASKVSSVSSATSTKTAGGWTLVSLLIKGSDVINNTPINIWCENDDPSIQAYVDDMRIQPLNATTTAYVYDPFSGELIDILDNNNLYTRFEYDAAGRLIHTFKEKLTIGEFKTNQYAYNYSAPKYGNNPINGAYSKNNCPVNAGYIGSSTSVTIPANTYTSFLPPPDADRIAGIYAQDYANVHGTCVCSPGFTVGSVVPGVASSVILSGTRVNFSIAITNPNSLTDFDLGQIAGSCSWPVAARTIPITVQSTVYNVTVSTSGDMQLVWISGPVLTGIVRLNGTFDLQTDLQYSDPYTSNFVKACPTGQLGSSVPYTEPAYKFAAVLKQDANSLAYADFQTAGQNNANSSGTCAPFNTCSLSWATGVGGSIHNVSVTGTTGSFRFMFNPPYDNWSGGTIGTITGGCLPVNPQSVNVTDLANRSRTWNVTIDQAGNVQASLTAGTAPLQTESVNISGTYSTH